MKQNENKTQEKTASYIVAIGASAGGLEALQEFFAAVPQRTGIGFVVIQHLSPDYKSLMDELLARHTKLRILKAEDGMPVERDTIYLIPPRKNLSIFHGKLVLEDQGKRSGIILPIDIFFRSLARELEKKAIGIILSGTGSDGTVGTRAIKEAGGMIMSQEPDTAKFDGMPRSSISTGLVDYILPPQQMPEAIINYIKHPFVEKQSRPEVILDGNEDNLTKIMMILRDYSGIDFSYYKENTIIRRLERRLSINRFEKIEDYLRLLSASEKEKDILYREMLIGVTRFFRDENAFEQLRLKVLPDLFAGNKKEIRIWSAGCSTGEEVYTLAILMQEYLSANKVQTEIKVFATDIDKQSLESAGQAVYPESIVSDIDPKLVARYFRATDNGYQISESLRKMVIFATHNVLRDPPFLKLDLIVCRNLFIYFKPDSQSYVLNIFRMALKKGGYLLMGSSETLGVYAEAFDVIDNKFKIYKKKEHYVSNEREKLPTTFMFKPHDLDQRSQFKPHPHRADKLAEQIFESMLPPSVVIDKNLNIIQLINNINPYAELRPGKFNQKLENLLPNEITALISNLFRRLKQKGEMVSFTNVKIKKPNEVMKVDLQGRLLSAEKGAELAIISFVSTEKLQPDSVDKNIENVETQFKDQIAELQYELQNTKENLQATVEELETSNEELQASNEELIASNEELQSTNEELQSVNEELYTVNSEYQNKIEELTQLNDDINNLLVNTEVAALYLDTKLCIRKFTPSFAKISKLVDYDIGRPIKEMATAFVYREFLEDIEKVQEHLKAIEKEVQTKDGMHFLLRIVPYRTDFYAVDGILVTMISINRLVAEREKLKMAKTRLEQALIMGNMAWWIWDVNSGKVDMHEKRATMLGYTIAEFPTDFDEMSKLIHQDDYKSILQQIKDFLDGKLSHYDLAYRIRAKNGSYKWLHDKGGAVEQDKNGKPIKVMGLVSNLSEHDVLVKKICREFRDTKMP